jgi:hypothetical protein
MAACLSKMMKPQTPRTWGELQLAWEVLSVKNPSPASVGKLQFFLLAAVAVFGVGAFVEGLASSKRKIPFLILLRDSSNNTTVL